MDTTPYSTLRLIVTASLITVVGCNSAGTDPQVTPTTTAMESKPVLAVSDMIKLNQVGYPNDAEKLALIPSSDATRFNVVNTATGEVAYSDTLSESFAWLPSGDTQFKLADFSPLTSVGDFRIDVEGIDSSYTFSVGDGLYSEARQAALRYYYLNRAGLAVEERFDDKWQRRKGHTDEHVAVHPSAAGAGFATEQTVASPKGWYDAGDYGKYTVNSGIATYTLLAAYEHYPSAMFSDATNIPESGNGVADVLDEAKWNLDWMHTMQAVDGSVVHKLTSLEWPGKEMPHEDTRTRYLIGKSTSAALDFAATMAVASRVYASVSGDFTDNATQWLEAAIKAWEWAQQNPNLVYVQPEDVKSGEYGDDSFNDEFAWAAAELFVTTGDLTYFDAFQTYKVDVKEASWQHVAALPYLTLLNKGKPLLDVEAYQSLVNEFMQFADALIDVQNSSLIRLPIATDDFVWGSNAVMMNKAIVLLEAYRLTQDSQYANGARHLVNYVMGYNPTGFSFITGFGDKAAVDPHHRISISDDVAEPHPGMLVGGPHAGRQDGCDYDDLSPAGSYIDDWCSYATNEVAINWNAPLYYVLTALSE